MSRSVLCLPLPSSLLPFPFLPPQTRAHAVPSFLQPSPFKGRSKVLRFWLWLLTPLNSGALSVCLSVHLSACPPELTLALGWEVGLGGISSSRKNLGIISYGHQGLAPSSCLCLATPTHAQPLHLFSTSASARNEWHLPSPPPWLQASCRHLAHCSEMVLTAEVPPCATLSRYLSGQHLMLLYGRSAVT